MWNVKCRERYRAKGDEGLVYVIQHLLHYFDFKEAEQFYRTFYASGPTARHIALLNANDRYFLLTRTLGRKDAIHPWLYDRCREVEHNPDGRIDLWAREHYKSTVITFAGAVQEIIVNPDITIGIFAHSRKISGAFLGQIKGELEQNDDLKALHPDVFWQNPRREAPQWSLSTGIVVKRKSNPKEATIEAWGLIDGQPTSKHFSLMIYDDVITRENVTNPEMVNKTTEAFELSDNLGGGDARKWIVGTRYSFADTYAVMLERKIAVPRIYPATDNGQPNGTPVFMSAARWAEKRKIQSSTLAAQMLQNPMAGNENMFRAEWFRPWEVRPKTLNIYIMADPSKGKSAGNDNTAIAVVGIDTAGNKYFLDGYRHRMSMSERWVALKGLYLKWLNTPGVKSVNVGYERYGMQTDDEYFQERMQIERFSFPIKELNWTGDGVGNQSKEKRVERLEPDVRLGRFHFPAVVHVPGSGPESGPCLWRINKANSHTELRRLDRPTKAMAQMEATGQTHRVCKPIIRRNRDNKVYDLTRGLIEEMTFFPFGQYKDLVDAVSRIYDMEPIAPSMDEEKMIEEFENTAYEDA